MASILLIATLIVLPGCLGVVVFGYYALVDFEALNLAYAQYASLSQSSTEVLTLSQASTQQMIHRINLFADGTWTLLSWLGVAIGLTGIFLLQRRSGV